MANKAKEKAGVKDKVGGLRTFWTDVVAEMKKTSWPTREELVQSTIVVIVSVCLVSLFVGISDKILVTVLRLLVPSG